jgi:hypothetical protein
MEKVKAFFDSKATWVTLGVFAGTFFGQKGADIVSGLGALVMAAI